MISVLFICRANICRSATAHAVFARLVAEAGYSDKIQVDSAGTNSPYPGRVPDKRAQKVATGKGYDLSQRNAQQLTDALAADSDYLVVMDDRNYRDATELMSEADQSKMRLLLSFADFEDQQLYDPFFSGDTGGMGFIPEPVDRGERAFKVVLEKIEVSCRALLREIENRDLVATTGAHE